MRATSLSIVVLFTLTAAACADENIAWVRDLETAKRIAAQANRPILIHFWAPSCPPCLRLDQDVYTRPEVKRALEATFVPVRLNAEEYPATASIYGVERWPTDVVLAPNGQFVARLQCPPAANQYLAQLELIARPSRALSNDGPAAIAATGVPAAPSSSPFASAPPSNGAFAQPPIYQASAFGTAPAAAAPVNSAAPASTAAPAAPFGAPTDRIANYDFRNADLARASSQRGSAYATDPRASQTPATVAGVPGVGVPGVERSEPPAFRAAPAAERNEPTAFHQTSQQVSTQPSQQQLNLQAFEMVAAGAAPPVGLDGFCPVQLRKEGGKQGRWVKGDPRYGVVHRGRTYLFCGLAEQQEFLRDPDRYSPVMAGNDPVLALDFGQQVPGQRKIGRYYGDRVYMFASEETLARFLAEVDESQARSRPNRYAEAILQAENAGRSMMR